MLWSSSLKARLSVSYCPLRKQRGKYNVLHRRSPGPGVLHVRMSSACLRRALVFTQLRAPPCTGQQSSLGDVSWGCTLGSLGWSTKGRHDARKGAARRPRLVSSCRVIHRSWHAGFLMCYHERSKRSIFILLVRPTSQDLITLSI